MKTLTSERSDGRHADRQLADVPMNYHVLRTALKRFGKPATELNQDEKAQVLAQARREYEIEARILGSTEACDVVIPDDSVDSALSTIEQRYADHDEFLAALSANDMDLTALREALKRELTVEAVLERVGSRTADVSDVDAMIYYYLHKNKFDRPETRTARHILITINPDFAENTQEAARARAEAIQRRLRRKPHRFGEQAIKHSECPTAMQEGLLGRLPRGQLYEALDAALFSLREGAVSEVLESPLGFHVLYCETVHPSGPVPVKQALPQIREKLSKRRRRMCQRAWLASLDAEEQV